MIAGAMVVTAGALLAAPLVYLPMKRWNAARSLERFVSRGFKRRGAMPVGTVAISAGGHFRCTDAFDGRLRDGLRVTLLLGNWTRETTLVGDDAETIADRAPINDRVGGFIVRASALPDLRALDLLLVAPVSDGTLVLWSGLPTGESMTRHGRELSAAMAKS